jgi:hypothetical protein
MLITFFGFIAKTNENLMLFQSLSATFMYALVLIHILMPTQDPSDGLFFLIGVMMPSLIFMIIPMTVLGVKGLLQWKYEKDKFLLLTSVASVSSLVTVVFFQFLFPILTVYILGRKAVRKWKGRVNQ